MALFQLQLWSSILHWCASVLKRRRLVNVRAIVCTHCQRMSRYNSYEQKSMVTCVIGYAASCPSTLLKHYSAATRPAIGACFHAPSGTLFYITEEMGGKRVGQAASFNSFTSTQTTHHLLSNKGRRSLERCDLLVKFSLQGLFRLNCKHKAQLLFSDFPNLHVHDWYSFISLSCAL